MTAPHLRARAGFSLPELIVAMMILTVGILALASGSAGVLRQMRAGNQTALAALVAQSRMEMIRSQTCGTLASGSATTRGLSESWTITATSGRINEIHDTVTYTPRPGVTRTYTLVGVIPCI
jgi:prepilin-type N-terminal cleavage/methylation domain-containing protein